MAFLAAAVTVTMLSAVSPASSFLTSSRTSRFLSSVRSQFADADTASTDLSFRWKQVDTDYCLVPQDTSVSGASATKTLNRLTNRVVREVLVRRPAVGGSGEVTDSQPLIVELPTIREYFKKQFGSDGSDELRYWDCVAAIALDGSDRTTPASSIYIAAHRRLLNVLRQSGYSKGQELVDSNFCLSMLDLLADKGSLRPSPVVDLVLSEPLLSIVPAEKVQPSPGFFTRVIEFVEGLKQPVESNNAVIEVAAQPAAPPMPLPIAGLVSCGSVTRALNFLSNRIRRTLLYGEEVDVRALESALVEGRPAFAARWGEDNDATAFYDALCDLMKNGLRCNYASLKSSYLDGFQRLMNSLVETLGTTDFGRASWNDLLVLNDFALWERSVRMNMTGSLWDDHPSDLLGGWSLVETDSASLLSSTKEASFRYDEGGGTSRARPTSARATRRPNDSPDTLLVRPSAESVPPVRPVVTLSAGGAVDVTAADCVGLSWRLDPGPTHLDTCYISVEAPRGSFAGVVGTVDGAGVTETLTFIGYVDRGQRIESRFSKRQIRMSGLVVTSDGKAVTNLASGKPASRFVMEKIMPLG